MRQRGLSLWPRDDQRHTALVARRCNSAESVAEWVREVYGKQSRINPGPKQCYSQIAANAVLVLIGVACTLLDRQLAAQARAFTQQGGFTERLYRVRTQRKHQGP